jgi:hypothetical protein
LVISTDIVQLFLTVWAVVQHPYLSLDVKQKTAVFNKLREMPLVYVKLQRTHFGGTNKGIRNETTK